MEINLEGTLARSSRGAERCAAVPKECNCPGKQGVWWVGRPKTALQFVQANWLQNVHGMAAGVAGSWLCLCSVCIQQVHPWARLVQVGNKFESFCSTSMAVGYAKRPLKIQLPVLLVFRSLHRSLSAPPA